MKEMIDFDDFTAFLEGDPIVVLDTSVLLDLYRTSSKTAENILENLEMIRGLIWLPAQVLAEFTSKKEDVRSTAFSKYKNVSTEIARILSQTDNALTKQLGSLADLDSQK